MDMPRHYTADILPLILPVSFGRFTVSGQEEVQLRDHPEKVAKLRMRADVILLVETWPLNHDERQELSDSFKERYIHAVKTWNTAHPEQHISDMFIFIRVLDRFGQ